MIYIVDNNNEPSACDYKDFNTLREQLCSEGAKITMLDVHKDALNAVRRLFPGIPTHPTRSHTRYTGEMANFLFNNL